MDVLLQIEYRACTKLREIERCEILVKKPAGTMSCYMCS